MRYMPNEWTFSYKWFSRKELSRFSKSDWTFEKNDRSLVACFTDNQTHTNPTWIGCETTGNRTKPEHIHTRM